MLISRNRNMKDIKAVLARIHKELQRAEDANAEAREILQDLNREVEQLEKADSTEIESQQWHTENTGRRFRSKTLSAALHAEQDNALW